MAKIIKNRFKIGDIVHTNSGRIWKRTDDNEWTCLFPGDYSSYEIGNIVSQGDTFISEDNTKLIINLENYLSQAILIK